ncbi:Pleckstrin homology domain-containing protein [Mycena leptocephala]|nr:Pleckstrin homology domain-containing protein [Mycena leptocephala]
MSDESLSHSVSFHQQFSALRDRLMQIRGFPHYFSLANPENPAVDGQIDRITPLCYIFDLLPEEDGFRKINHSEFNQEQYTANPDRAKRHAIVLFAMQIRTEEFKKKIPASGMFTVTDLWDRNSTDGFLKVVNTVTAIVNYLPPDAPPDDPKPALPTRTQENIIRELVETERKYGKDIELMHKYATVLSQSNWIDDNIRLSLFPNMNELFNFQRKFLIRLEATAELAWQDQNWGQHFLEAEKEFSEVYAPYCANYKLAPLNHLINVKAELPAFIKKPVGLLIMFYFQSLLKASSAADYQHYNALKQGSEASKRVGDRVNEALRRAENEQTVNSLQARVDDWKGHNVDNFGELLLYDFFVVNRSDVDREYYVFLFEKILLLCKEISKDAPNSRSFYARNTPLLLKDRIFVSNVTQVVPSSETDSNASSSPYLRRYSLTVSWKEGDHERDSFILRCRQEYQLKEWESKINGLIRPSCLASQPNDLSGGLDTDEHRQILQATPSGGSGSGPPQELPHLDATSARDTIPSDNQPPVQTDNNNGANPPSTFRVVKVTVHFNEDIFILLVPRTIDYDGLVEQIKRKIRLLGPLPDEPVRLIYKDHDGDWWRSTLRKMCR